MRDKPSIIVGLVSGIACAIVLILEGFELIILNNTVSWLFTDGIMIFTIHFANTLIKIKNS